MATGNGGAVASFWASLGVKTNKSDLLKVDKFLKDIESRFAKSKGGVGLKLSKFTVDQKALNMTLRDSFLVASRQISFEISRFTVNQRALSTALGGATAAASRKSSSSSGAMGAGAMLSRVYLPIAAVAAGGYGLSKLNKLNQKVVAGELQSQAVVTQAGGTQQQGTDSFNWLKYQANRIGFNYLDAVPSYNNTLAGLTHAGMSVKQGQNIFKGFSEQGRALKLDAVHQKRLFYAISEVADMNQLQKRQLNMINLALPGANSIFAQAYQTQTGGKLTGQAAEAELLKAITARKVNAGVLTPAANIASARATGNKSVWDSATHASVAEQSRYQNSIADLATVASNNGVEEGFARIFRTLNDGLSTSGPLVARLAEGFNEATKAFRALALLPQSFNRMLDGKDSFIGKLVGPEQVKEWQDNIKQLKDTWNGFTSTVGNTTWADYLKTTLKEVNSLLSLINNTISGSKTLSNIVGKAFGSDGAISGIMGDDRLSPSDKLKLVTQTFNKSSADMNPEDWQARRDQQVKDNTAPDFDYSKAGLGNDIPYLPTNPTNSGPVTQTTTIYVGDLNITSSATNAQDFAGDIKSQMTDAMRDAWSTAQLNYTKSGR